MRIQIKSMFQSVDILGLIIYRFPVHLSLFLPFVEETGWLIHRTAVSLWWCSAYSSVSCTLDVRFRNIFFFFLARLHHWWLCVFFKMLIISGCLGFLVFVFVILAALYAQCLDFLIHEELQNGDSSKFIHSLICENIL